MTAPSASPAAIAALQLAVEAENAAVYGYGAAGGHLTTARRQTAVADFVAHENARDAVSAALHGRGGKVPAALPGYAVPAIANGVAAATFLATLEDAASAAYADVLGATDDPAVRRLAVAQLTASAVRAAAWRLAAGVKPAVKAFPGIAGKPT